MVTEKQIEANKENAKLGGVKTEEGKAVSKYNALKHGLLSQEVIMKGEDEKTLLELEKRLRNELKPATEIELLLVDRIAANIWRLKRALGFEEDEVISEYEGELGLKGDADLFFRYEIMLERSIYKALHELQRIQATRMGEKPPLPVVVDVDISKD
ncbi:MAG: hypothetical protein Q8N09_04505 [Thermodesulfovibrionia bacterium]|nr:hypothetical protein [Thermodesulfovibrionia bacterium]